MSDREIITGLPTHLEPSLHWLREAKSNTPLELGDYTIIEPAVGRVVLRMLDESNVTSAGIILPNASTESTHVGVVEVVSEPYDSAADDTDSVKQGPIYRVGDVVVISKYTGSELTIGSGLNRRKRIVCYESDIICKFKRGPGAGSSPAAGQAPAQESLYTGPKKL